MSWNGKKGDNITIQQVGTGNDLIFNAGCSGGFSITNPWGTTDITDSTTTTTTTDTTDKDGGDDAEPCIDPNDCAQKGMVYCCIKWGDQDYCTALCSRGAFGTPHPVDIITCVAICVNTCFKYACCPLGME